MGTDTTSFVFYGFLSPIDDVDELEKFCSENNVSYATVGNVYNVLEFYICAKDSYQDNDRTYADMFNIENISTTDLIKAADKLKIPVKEIGWHVGSYTC